MENFDALIASQQEFLNAGYTLENRFRMGCLVLIKRTLEQWPQDEVFDDIKQLRPLIFPMLKMHIKQLQKSHWKDIFSALFQRLFGKQNSEKIEEKIEPKIIEIQAGESSFLQLFEALSNGQTIVAIASEKAIANNLIFKRVIEENFTADFVAYYQK